MLPVPSLTLFGQQHENQDVPHFNSIRPLINAVNVDRWTSVLKPSRAKDILPEAGQQKETTRNNIPPAKQPCRYAPPKKVK
jgi:hypothetical protein